MIVAAQVTQLRAKARIGPPPTHELLAGFPPSVRTVDARLAAVAAADELASGSLERPSGT